MLIRLFRRPQTATASELGRAMRAEQERQWRERRDAKTAELLAGLAKRTLPAPPD
jgi:hypothetical protein